MKKRNIVFSGFMAAVLFGAGAANAAMTQIASKQYVDDNYATKTVVQGIQTTVDGLDTIITAPDTGLQDTVGKLDDAINNAETGLSKKVEDALTAAQDAETAVGALEVTVGDENSGLVKDVNDLKTGLDGKLSSDEADLKYQTIANKTDDLSQDGTSTTKYPSAKAVTDAITKATEGVASSGAITDLQNKVGDGVLTTTAQDLTGAVNELDSALDEKADKTALDTKQDKNIPGATNHIVITDGEGNITTAAQIAADKVSGLATVATSGEYSDLSGTPTIPTAVSELTNDSGFVTSTDLSGLQAKNVGVDKSGNILTVDAEGNISTSATIEQDKVNGLTDALAGKASIDDIPTTVAELTDSANYVTTTTLSNYVTNEALTDDLNGKQDKANMTQDITSNIASTTLYPSAKAVVDYVTNTVAEGVEVNTSQIADGAITEAKLHDDLKNKINGKADADDVYTKNDVYTKTETNEKILEVALRRPTNTCTGTELCVLSITPEGGLAWVNVTDPVGELPAPTIDIDAPYSE